MLECHGSHKQDFTWGTFSTGSVKHDMARKALITGATGLLGRQVLKAFQEAGWDLVGTGFSRAKPPSIIKLDVSDEAAVSSALDELK